MSSGSASDDVGAGASLPATVLRFCIATTFYPPYNFGGDGIYAHRLANGLARLGHQVTVVHSPTAYEMLAGGPPVQTYNDHPNVTLRPVRTSLGKLGLLAVQQTGRPVFQTAALRRWIEHGSYDVIHYNNVSLLGGPQVFRYGHALKLCTLIEHWLVCPMHVLWKMDREVCRTPSCLRCQLAGGRPPQLWRYGELMRRATQHIDTFVGPSLFTIRMHQERGLRGMMVQLPLFHPEPTEPPATPPANGGRPYFLFSGRLEKIKGVQIIIPVFRTCPDIDLLIAGDGTFENELRTLAAGAANIKFVGRVDQGNLQRLYRDAIATVVPSLSYETFGLIIVESYSASTPVLVYAQSSLAELVSTHGGGLMYHSLDELRAAIERLRSDPPLRARLGREGRAAYEAEFAEAIWLRHYLDVVRALLDAKRAGISLDAACTPGTPPMLAGRRVFRATEPCGSVA